MARDLRKSTLWARLRINIHGVKGKIQKLIHCVFVWKNVTGYTTNMNAWALILSELMSLCSSELINFGVLYLFSHHVLLLFCFVFLLRMYCLCYSSCISLVTRIIVWFRFLLLCNYFVLESGLYHVWPPCGWNMLNSF